MEKRTRIAIMIVFVGILFLIVALITYKAPLDVKEPEGTGSELMGDLPHGEMSEMSGDKVESYVPKNSRSNNNIALYDSCGFVSNGTGDTNVDPLAAVTDPEGPAPAAEDAGERTSEELFGGGSQGSAPAGRSGSGGGNPYRETPQQREQRHQKRREEAIELADHMSGREQTSDELFGEPEPERITIESPSVGSGSGVISSLGNADGGVSSLGSDRPETPDERHPYRCVFLHDEKLKVGQRVAVRLMEDLPVTNVVIPKNTHLMAYVKIGSRLELDINSIEMNGHIIPLGYEAYDTDGTKGIYCPEAGEAKRTVRTSGLGVIGSTLGGRVGRIAGEVVNTGVSIAQSASGERTVSVPAGYDFFIVKRVEH